MANILNTRHDILIIHADDKLNNIASRKDAYTVFEWEHLLYVYATA